MLVVWAVGAAITYLMLEITWFMETVGFVAVFTEAMLGTFLKLLLYLLLLLIQASDLQVHLNSCAILGINPHTE